MQLRYTAPILFVTLLTLALGVGCGSGTNSPAMNDGGATNSNSSPQTPTNTAPGAVVSRIEKAGTVEYKIYLQPEANATNRKGIVLLGSGNNEMALDGPATGILDGPMENSTANELAKQGYVSAIVAYRKQPTLLVLPVVDPANPKIDDVKWNTASQELALDLSNVADTIIATYGSGLNRSKVITGGVSYTSFMLLTENGGGNKLADTRGMLATCGSTGPADAKNFKVPVYSLSCSGNPEGNLEGEPLISEVAKTNQNPIVVADSGFFTDPACNTHCGGDVNLWTSKMVERVQLWLP